MTYTHPTPAQVREFLRRHHLTGSAAADLAGLAGGQQVRKYTGGEKPHRVSYAIWFTWHAKTVLTPDQIDNIETAMRESTDA